MISVNCKITIVKFMVILQAVEYYATALIDLPNLGSLSGITLDGYRDGQYEAFMGIPYAEPPINNLRFANPQPVKPWTDKLEAVVEKQNCIQKNYLFGLNAPVTGEEDCLYLNIYRPICDHCVNLPVMVYIHGGGFFAGDYSRNFTGPEYFMDTESVILVTIAYRLGALGFLSTGDSSMPGNFGLKDQQLALKFVKQNIVHFGGDPERITIFGQSAGAASCHLHMLVPSSKGLFNKVITMSGNAAAPYNEPIKDPKPQAYLQGKYSGIENVDSLTTQELTEKLRESDAKTIVESGDKFKYWQIDPVVVFKNVIEDVDNPDSFLTKHPKELIDENMYEKVPWMNGFVPNEGAVRVLQITENGEATQEFNKDFTNLLTKLLELPNSDEFKVNAIVNHYMKGVFEINADTKDGFGKIITDWAFYYPLYKSYETYLSKSNSAPLFLYYFNYDGPYSFSSLFTTKLTQHGVVHCDDLIYLFRMHLMDNFGWQPFPVNSNEYRVVLKFVDMFVDFAEKNNDELPQTISVCTKEKFFNDSPNSICDQKLFVKDRFSSRMKITETTYFNENDMKFWDSLFV